MDQWSHQQLATLRRLRDGFLSRTAGAQDYWKTPGDLEIYDQTFGERIGWKWDAVLSELSLRGWHPQSRHVFDFACGSGIAGRRVATYWPDRVASLTLHDRSPAAMRHAAARAREIPGLSVECTATTRTLKEPTLLVISHVISELSSPALESLLAVCRQAQEIIWVEAGTHADSRRLISEIREPLRASGEYEPVAPCTHQESCGMLTGNNGQHWCHHFAKPPSAAFQSAGWAEFSRELGIDLRSLPYSFLVLQKKSLFKPPEPGLSRVIGHAREYKGFSKVLSCQEEGVCELTLQKRDAPEVYRELRNPDGRLACYRWTMHDGKIVGGDHPFTIPSSEPRS